MKDIAFWAKLIAEILLLLAKKFPKEEAVSIVAKKYNISESKIWEHGGF